MGPSVNIEEIRAFEADIANDKTLSSTDRVMLKDKFFAQKIKVSPEWVEAPPEVRFKFAKQFGISPGLAQEFEGEFYVRGGKPAGGEFGEGPFETGILPMPKGDLGEVRMPDPFQGEIAGTILDPSNAVAGGVAGLAAKAPFIGQILAARNPLIREAAKRGIMGSAIDWQLMGLHRLPGFLGRQGANIMQRLRGGNMPQAGQMEFQFPQGQPQMGRPGPGSGAPPMMPEISGGSLPASRPRIRYGPRGIEDITE